MPPINSINSHSSVAILTPQDIPVHLLFCTSLDFVPIRNNYLHCAPCTAQSLLSALKYRKIRIHWQFWSKVAGYKPPGRYDSLAVSSPSSPSSSSRLNKLFTARFTSRFVRWSSRIIILLDFPCKTTCACKSRVNWLLVILSSPTTIHKKMLNSRRSVVIIQSQ